MQYKNEQSLHSLIDLALNDNPEHFTSPDDWQEVLSLASRHGVLGIAIDGLEKLPREQRPDIGRLMTWFGAVIKQEQQYQRTWRLACQLADLWKQEGIETVVLKGRSLAQYYPRPEHRYSCDLDVFIPRGWQNACELLRSKGVHLFTEVYKEAEFTVGGIYVECHRVITPVRGNKTLQEFELYLRELLGSDTGYFVGTRLTNPPLMFNAMLFIEHALGDFLHGKLLLKHLVDWMVLRKQAIDWHEFNRACEHFGFLRFVLLINSLTDVMEAKAELSSLPPSYQNAFDEILHPHVCKTRKSQFGKRVDLFFDIIRNHRRFKDFGYCPMTSFLLNAIYSHFFKTLPQKHSM